ncbi:MAG: flippase-like domain-containing protein [Calditrichaeota bacterium]|nr:flippase-like domain-containing protein [Calditrichota bacterium]
MTRHRAALGVGLSLFFIYLAVFEPDLKGYFGGQESLFSALFSHGRIDFTHVWEILGRIQLWPIVASILLTPVHVFLRGYRWRTMVEPVVTTDHPRMTAFDGFSLHTVGYLANAALPLKVGEVARAVLLARRIGISRSTAIATVILERVIDLLSLLLLIAVIWFFFPIPKRFTDAALVLGLVSSAIFALFAYFATSKKPFKGLFGRLFGRGLMGRRARRMIERFIVGLSVLRASHHLLGVSLWTLALYVIYAAQVWLMMEGFGFISAYPLISASPVVACFVILIVDSIAIALPSAPSAVGTFHAITLLGLSLFDVPADPAMGFAIVQHLGVTLYSFAFGIPCLWREGVKLAELKGSIIEERRGKAVDH